MLQVKAPNLNQSMASPTKDQINKRKENGGKLKFATNYDGKASESTTSFAIYSRKPKIILLSSHPRENHMHPTQGQHPYQARPESPQSHSP